VNKVICEFNAWQVSILTISDSSEGFEDEEVRLKGELEGLGYALWQQLES
jgi:hypothetical protein